MIRITAANGIPKLLTLALFMLCTLITRAQLKFDPGIAIAVAKAGPNDTISAYTIYTSDNVLNPTAFTAGASFNNGRDINGFGYNKIDSLLYGAAYTGDTILAATLFNVNLYRLDAAGNLKNLGKLPNSGQSNTISLLGGIRAEIPNYAAGFTDSLGRYFYLTVGFNPTGIEKLANGWSSYKFGGDMHPNPGLVVADIKLYLCWINNIHLLDSTNMPATVAGYRKIDFSDPSATGAVQLLVNDMNAVFPRVGRLNGGMQDFARSPLDNAFYGYISYPAGGGDSIAGRPVTFVTGTAANTFVMQPVGTTENSYPQSEMTGIHFDITGQMFGLFKNGAYTRIDLATGALAGLSQSNIPIAAGQLWGDMAGLAHEGTLPPGPEALYVTTLNNVPALIQTPGGSLQMIATIDPPEASQSVTWSVVAVTGQASVDNAGYVTAIADGTVYVKAVATGYPDIADSIAVLISNQDTTTNSIQILSSDRSFVTVYPNPSAGRIFLKTISGKDIRSVAVTDMAGRQIWRREYDKNRHTAGTELDLDQPGNGLYLLHVKGDDFSAVIRFVIHHSR